MAVEFARSMTLEGRRIGVSEPVFIIAEIGVNHNGDLELARALVREAAACGVDCVKFQTYRAEEFVGSRDLTLTYRSAGRTVVENQFEMFRRLEMPDAWHEELFALARSLGVVPLTSVADCRSADVALAAGTPAFKLASEDLVNLPLLEHVAALDRPLLLSTGMATDRDVQDALDVLERHAQRQVAFLHCVSVYPTPDDEVRLGRMTVLARRTGALVGYSDHSFGTLACAGAVALGATILEKHFTLDRSLPGPDHDLSADPAEMRRLVEEVRRLEAMRGGGEAELAPSPTEWQLRPQVLRSVVAARPLPAGHTLSARDLRLKRMGVEGLRYRDIGGVVGRVLRRPLEAGELVLPRDLAGNGAS